MPSADEKIPADMFSAEEIRTHKAKLPLIANTAAKYIDDTYADHIKFYEKHGVSKYYGNQREDYATRAGRADALKELGKPTALADQQVGTACVVLAMRAVENGLAAAGLQGTWEKINDILAIDTAFLGTDLQMMLRQLGWKTYYWNPNPAKNAQWDADDKAINPLDPGRAWNAAWGGHAVRYRTATEDGHYSGKPVDNAEALVGFGSKPPAAFRTVPFFVGIAHDGYHVFPGRRGEVIEAHSSRDIDDVDNIEISPFNPLGAGGGPRWTEAEKYRSGLITVPAAF